MKRQLRYRKKVEFIAGKIASIPGILNNPLAIDATLYRLQISIDAIMDIIAMLVKDKGEEVSDDYNNIRALEKIKVLDKKLADNITMLNGLRNAIVHKYNKFEEETVIKDISKIKKLIRNFLDKVENELKNIFK